MTRAVTDYTVVDIETTGFNPATDRIIELAAVKVRDGVVVDTYSSLINIYRPLPSEIVNLTGITDDMLKNAPDVTFILKRFVDFAQDDIIIGHNVNFDINFIYDFYEKFFNKHLTNDYIDTLRIARKALPTLKNHKLDTLIKHYKIENQGHHRALADTIMTQQLYEYLKKDIEEQKTQKNSASKKLSAKDITTTNTSFDENHILYNKLCVISGSLNKMERRDAMQKIVDLGGSVGDNVTMKTNYLILGNETSPSVIDGKSAKLRRAEELIEKGKDIKIIKEEEFYKML